MSRLQNSVLKNLLLKWSLVTVKQKVAGNTTAESTAMPFDSRWWMRCLGKLNGTKQRIFPYRWGTTKVFSGFEYFWSSNWQEPDRQQCSDSSHLSRMINEIRAIRKSDSTTK